jgi:hypothetical protein
VHDPSTVPYSSRVSKVTVAVNVSRSPDNSKSCGTRHEYPQVPPHPNGIKPLATTLPDELVMETRGTSDA